MEKLHLLCNAHLDPVWLWCRDEGLAEAISTFRVAADFCEKYDGFIFNHNEALLYEWVEEHEPALFKRIKKLVKKKKWIIMGGWYLQPDCVMTSGESLMEQIRLGREYFKEKFGVVPTTAINFDPFGHSRGLVQILVKNGYDSYVFMRPPHTPGDFLWEGFDGSKVIAHGLWDSYLSLRGQAVNKIKKYIDASPEEVGNRGKSGLCLWGIGNHGGGPSKIDLENINEFIKTSDLEIVHSNSEAYISEVNIDDLKVVKNSLIPCNVGCYTTMTLIKQANRRLENKILLTEKIMNYAEITKGAKADTKELDKAKKALAFCQFHDILPGTAIEPVERESLKTINYGEEIIDRLYAKAFFKMCEGQKKAENGEIPIMAFNPHPYEIKGAFEVEFMLPDQNWNADEITLATVCDADGNALSTQNEKPHCTFNLDWIERVSFSGTLAPSSVTRFNCRLKTVKKDTLTKIGTDSDEICITNDRLNFSVNKKTGLIEKYEVDGKTYIENSGKIEIFNDNEDPWGMRVDSFSDKCGEFELMDDSEVSSFLGYPDDKTPNVRVVEDGPVRTKIQAFFSYNRSVAVVEYTVPKDDAIIDVNIKMHSYEPNKMIKYKIDTAINGKPYGETAFGKEALFSDGRECVYHKWCGIKGDNAWLYVINNGMYGGSFSENGISLSLLRTPIYSAHPIKERQVAPHDRYLKHIDIGVREFNFRITTEKNVARSAQIYNETPQLLSFFPSGEKRAKKSFIEIDNPEIILSSFRKNGKKYVMNLYNASDFENSAEIKVADKKHLVHFGKHELKTIEI